MPDKTSTSSDEASSDDEDSRDNMYEFVAPSWHQGLLDFEDLESWNAIDWATVYDYYTDPKYQVGADDDDETRGLCNQGPQNPLPYHKLLTLLRHAANELNGLCQANRGLKGNPLPMIPLAHRKTLYKLLELEDKWQNITAQDFVNTLYALEPFQQQEDYLNSLAMPVGSNMLYQLQVIPLHEQKQHTNVSLRIAYCNSLFTSGSERPMFDSFRRTSTQNYLFHALNCILTVLIPKPQKFYSFAYTSANKVFVRDSSDQSYIIKSLMDAAETGAFNTVIGRSLTSQAWQDVEALFYVARFLDIVNLFFLSMCGWALREGRQPDIITWGFLAMMSVRNVTTPLIEILMILCNYGPRHFLRKWLSPWNLFFLPLEIFSATSMWIMLRHTRIGQPCLTKSCWIWAHPEWFSFVVLARWTHFCACILCFNRMGLNVLPAFYTMVSEQSVWFLGFIMFCVFGSFQSYYMYPIAENLPQGTLDRMAGHAVAPGHEVVAWSHIVFTFMKMFRLCILGDFDIWELQGLDPVVKVSAPWVVGQTVAEVDDPTPTGVEWEWHIGIRGLFVICAVCIHLMVLNVYIGLLSSIYDDLYHKKRQLLSQYKTVFAWKLLLEKRFFQILLCECRCCSHRRRSRGSRPFKKSAAKSVWISYNADLFREEIGGRPGMTTYSDGLGKASSALASVLPLASPGQSPTRISPVHGVEADRSPPVRFF